jgi:acyl carrier protein phosphodiesterase
MNYLAHLYLAEGSPESLVGSILGDFAKGAIGDKYPQGVRRGIVLHRKIDAYTDAHEATRASRNLFSASRRRLAGIIVDLCYDHFLYRYWQTFADVAPDKFISSAYGILAASQVMLPGRLQAMIPVMIREDWLGSYRDLRGVEQALIRLSKRVTTGDRLPGAIEEIKDHYLKLEANFLIFFPDLKYFAKNSQIKKN